jgi:metal-responsive CopG/Arc/MetJ family transcriptional regulator
MRTVSYRLPSDVVQALGRAASRRGVARSAIVREALQKYLSLEQWSEETGALIDALVTYPGSGNGRLASDGEAILRARFRARRRSR